MTAMEPEPWANVHDWLANLPFTDPAVSCRIVEITFNNGSRKEYFKNTTLHHFNKGEIVSVEGVGGFDVGTVNLSGELVRLQLKKKRIAEKNEMMRFFRGSANDLQKIFDLMNILVDCKLMIVRKLETIRSIGTFIRTDDGYRITAPEGFVAVDRLKGNAVKLVDRLEFSQANFNAAKNWSK